LRLPGTGARAPGDTAVTAGRIPASLCAAVRRPYLPWSVSASASEVLVIERSLAGVRLHDLLACMKEDHISVEGKIDELKGELFSLTGDVNFKKAPNMGAVLQAALDFIRRNYKTENPFMR